MMSARPQFNWKQPVGGLELIWQPLNMRQQFQALGALSGPKDQHLRQPMLLANRIVSMNGKPGCTLQEIQEWDEIDYEAFMEEVELREAQRRAALQRDKSGTTPKEAVQLAVEKMRMALTELNIALGGLMEAATAIEQTGADPLRSAG